MAETPSTPQWPPGDEIDFDTLVARALALKRTLLTQHTAQDVSDPLIQLIHIVCALGQHAMGRANLALKQLSLKHATSRRAIIALMEICNRPLLPMVPSQGVAYAKLTVPPTISTTLVEKGTRLVQPNSIDPIYSVDADVLTGTSVSFSLWFYDQSAGTTTLTALPATIDDRIGDALIIGVQAMMFDGVLIEMTSAHTSPGQKYSLDYYNKETSNPDSVTDLALSLKFVLNSYLHADEVDLSFINGLLVTIACKLTGESQTVAVYIDGTSIVATTSILGQTSGNSTVTADYEVCAEWRPTPFGDATSGLSQTGAVTLSMTNVRSITDSWAESPVYGYAVRLRNTGTGLGAVGSITISTLSIGNRSYYVNVPFTQGYRSTFTVGQADGTAFQRIPLSSSPIYEPIDDPAIEIEVGGDADWCVVADLSSSGTNSKHVIVHEDVDDGWCVMFGDGTLGSIPSVGASVKLTYRSSSSTAGDIDAGTAIKAASSLSTVGNWVLPRPVYGHAVPEASDADSARRFRWSVVPQLSLRAESVVTPSEIETALSGGANGRATFITSDGRKPFTRAMFTTESAGDRQYNVIVVGSESDPLGSVSLADTAEAETWLNGESVGIQLIGGHGPLNTQGIVRAFSNRSLQPFVTITARDTSGMREAADAVLRSLIKPHSMNEDGSWRWGFGGYVPVALLFGALWDALPGRTMITITVHDGVTMFALNDSIKLEDFELPSMSPSYTSSINITLVEV